MKICATCSDARRCRVPTDSLTWARVLERLEGQHRQHMLCDKLHHFLGDEVCLVETGIVDLLG